ncbi:putative protein FAM47D [Ctenodactylus gundi]
MLEQSWLLRPWVGQPMPLGMTCKPWYCDRDRLPSKCLAKHKQDLVKFPSSLDRRLWVFVKEGLDDFRDGCPSCHGLILRGAKDAYVPTVIRRGLGVGPATDLSKHPSLYCRLSRAQLAQKQRLERLETLLARHPLADHPALEEDLPPHFLRRMLEVLDPDQKLKDTWAYCETQREGTRKPSKPPKWSQGEVTAGLPKFPESRRYTLLQDDKTSTLNFLSPLRRNFVPAVVPEFCSWVSSVGNSDIHEEFLRQKFDLGFHCPPKYIAQSRIKNLKQLPSEFKLPKMLKKGRAVRFSVEDPDIEWKRQVPQDPYKPKREKIRYGAWYLKPELWTKLVNDEPLIDPQILLEARRERPDIIEELYGTIAFKDFILGKRYSMPGILERLFKRKGWSYDKIVTPMPRVVKAYKKELAAIIKREKAWFAEERMLRRESRGSRSSPGSQGSNPTIPEVDEEGSP